MSNDRIGVTPVELFVRCFIEKKGNQWQAFSVEFGLAAQADSLDEARAKIDGMIACYIEDALVGEDSKHAEELLNRRSTFYVWFKYHYYVLIDKYRKRTVATPNTFREKLPLAPLACAA